MSQTPVLAAAPAPPIATGGEARRVPLARVGAASSASSSERAERTPWLALAGLMALATILRAINLNGGLWLDEVLGLLYTFRGSFGDVLTTYPGDVKHPLYALLTNVVMTVAGESPWSLRLAAAVFGVATVPALYFFAREIASRREALLAATLLTVSYHHVWFSQNARGYTVLAFFTLVSSTALLRALREGRRGQWVAYAVLAALGVYTHLTMVFAVAGQALAAAWDVLGRRRHANGRWRALGGPLFGFALATVLGLLLYAPMLSSVIEYFANKPSELRGVSSPSWALAEAARVLRLGLGAGGGLGALVLVGGVVIVAAGGLSLLRRHSTALLLMTLPAVVTIVGAALARGTMYPRFFFFMIGFALVIVVHGATVVSQWVAERIGGARRPSLAGWLATAMVGVLIVGSLASLPFNYRFPKQDYVGAMRFIEAEKAPDDLVAAVGGAPMVPFRELLGKPWLYPSSAAELEQSRIGHRVWVVYTFPRYLEHASPDLHALVRDACTVRSVFHGTVGAGDLTVCTLEPA